MSTIRHGNKSALVVVDVQVGVVSDAWNAPLVVKNVARAVERARAAEVPVIWVQHEGDDLPRNSTAWQLVPELAPAEAESRIYKRFESSFEGTALEENLACIGVTHIVLAGAQTNWCIRATAYAAFDRGYDLTLLKDAHTTTGIELGNGLSVEAANIINDLNVTMTWIRYPGRNSGTAATEEVVFAVPGGAAD